jgi:hypothetical protein
MDVAAGYLTRKLGSEFTLKTGTGPVDFAQPAGLPPMREGDMVLVVVADNGAMLAVSDLTLGLETRYRPYPPYKNEVLSARWLWLICLFVISLPSIGYALAKGGVPVESVYVLAIASFFYVCLFLTHWYRLKNHNQRISDDVQSVIRNGAMDSAIWEISEPETHDGEKWKD